MRLHHLPGVFGILVLAGLASGTAQAGLQFDLKWGSTGTGDRQFLNAFDCAVDATGQVYVVDDEQHRVQKFQADGTFVTAWGDSGGATGQFSFPKGIAVDAAGNVYVADSNNNRIQKFTGSGAFLLQWGTSGSNDGEFRQPRAIVAAPDGHIYVTEDAFAQKRVQKFTSTGLFVTKWGSIGTGDGQFSSPRGIVADESGFVYVTDAYNDRVQKFTSTGTFVTKWGFSGSGPGQLSLPVGITFSGSSLFVTENGNHRVQEFDTDGNFRSQFGSLCQLSDGTGCVDPDGPGPLDPGDGQFNGPRGLSADRLGQLYVVDGGNDRVQKSRDPLVIGIPGEGDPGRLVFLAAPNPFRSSVRLSVQIPEAAAVESGPIVTARILDLAGREIRRLWEGPLPAGIQVFEWNGTRATGAPSPAGIYFAVLEVNGRRAGAVKVVRAP